MVQYYWKASLPPELAKNFSKIFIDKTSSQIIAEILSLEIPKYLEGLARQEDISNQLSTFAKTDTVNNRFETQNTAINNQNIKIKDITAKSELLKTELLTKLNENLQKIQENTLNLANLDSKVDLNRVKDQTELETEKTTLNNKIDTLITQLNNKIEDLKIENAKELDKNNKEQLKKLNDILKNSTELTELLTLEDINTNEKINKLKEYVKKLDQKAEEIKNVLTSDDVDIDKSILTVQKNINTLLTTINKSLTNLDAKKQEFNAKIDEITKKLNSLDNNSDSDIIKKLNDLKSSIDEKIQTFTTKYNKLLLDKESDIRNAIETFENNLSEAINNSKLRLESDLNTKKTNLEAKLNELDTTENKINELNTKLQKYLTDHNIASIDDLINSLEHGSTAETPEILKDPKVIEFLNSIKESQLGEERKMWFGSQKDYDKIQTKSNNTLYFIYEADEAGQITDIWANYFPNDISKYKTEAETTYFDKFRVDTITATDKVTLRIRLLDDDPRSLNNVSVMLDGTEEQFTYNSENYWIMTKDYPLNGKTVDELDHELRSKAYCVHIFASPLDYGNHDSYFFINKKTIPEDLDYYVYPRAMGNDVEGRKTWQTEQLYYSTTPAIDFGCKAATFYMKDSGLGGLDLVFDYNVSDFEEKFKHNLKSMKIKIDSEEQIFDLLEMSNGPISVDNHVIDLHISNYPSNPSQHVYNFGFLENVYEITFTDVNNIEYKFKTELTYKFDNNNPIPMTKTKLDYKFVDNSRQATRMTPYGVDRL